MRLLEHHNPEIDFDWTRLLKDASQDQAGRRDRDRDPRDRDRRERRDGRDQRPAPRPRPLDTTAAAVPPTTPATLHDTEAEIAEERAAAHADLMLDEARHVTDVATVDSQPEIPDSESAVPESVAVSHGEPLAADHAEYVEYAHAAHVTHEPGEPERADPEPSVEPEAPAAAARLGTDGVARLRARYAQLVSRLADKPMDDATRAELTARIERLNPDAWRTADEVAAALEQYESVFDSVRAHVGHNPRGRL